MGAAGIALAPHIEAVGRRLLGQTPSLTRAIAAPASRRFAFLVGIDNYANGLQPLQGCVTDVALQKEVLEHRFGFSEIVTLTDREASREAIERTFMEAIVDRVDSNDSVVFHFSGYGRILPDGTPLLLPVDAKGNPNDGKLNDLPLETLYQLVHALNTNRVTVVLDCGFAAGEPTGLGNWRLRSLSPLPAERRAGQSPYELAPDVLTQQDLIRSKYRIATRSSPFTPNHIEDARGNWLLAASPGQSAAEGQWDGFSAGVFTYLLTQSLWESNAADRWKQVFLLTSAKAQQAAILQEKPTMQGKGSNPNWPYSTAPSFTVRGGVSGAIQTVQNSHAEIWLGGVLPGVLPFLEPGTRFKGYEDDREWVLKSRDKLTAQVELAKSPSVETTDQFLGGHPITGRSSTPSSWVSEVQRVIPLARLAIALDSSLERIEKVDATSALSNTPMAGEHRAIETAQLHERYVDCLFGRMTPELRAELQVETPPEVGSYGLMGSGRVPILDTFGPVGEAPKSAIKRSLPRLQHLLAVKRLRTTLNSNASGLPLVLEIASDETVWQEGTALASSQGPLVRQQKKGRIGIPQLPVGTPVAYSLSNRGNRPVNVILMVRDYLGNLCVLTHQQEGGEFAFSVAPYSKLDFAQNLGLNLAVHSPRGLTEVFAIASIHPFAETYQMLQDVAREMGVSSGFAMLPRPLDFAHTVLSELTSPGTMEETRLLTHKDNATLSLAYEAV